MRYDYPAGMKPTPVRERERFYREEFETAFLEERMERWKRFVPVIDIGTDSTLYKPRLQELKGKLVRIKEYRDLPHLVEKIGDYAPEDIYYSRTISREGQVDVNPTQELVFRIAPHQLDCRKCDRKRQHMEKQYREYVFCRGCFADAAHHTRNLYMFLERHFDDMDLVYTGRAFHLHVNDEEGFQMQQEDRWELARKVARQFPIQKDITAGDTDLVRLPGSLNGLVSRTVTQLSVSHMTDPDHIIESLSVPDALS